MWGSEEQDAAGHREHSCQHSTSLQGRWRQWPRLGIGAKTHTPQVRGGGPTSGLRLRRRVPRPARGRHAEGTTRPRAGRPPGGRRGSHWPPGQTPTHPLIRPSLCPRVLRRGRRCRATSTDSHPGGESRPAVVRGRPVRRTARACPGSADGRGTSRRADPAVDAPAHRLCCAAAACHGFCWEARRRLWSVEDVVKGAGEGQKSEPEIERLRGTGWDVGSCHVGGQDIGCEEEPHAPSAAVVPSLLLHAEGILQSSACFGLCFQ